MSRRIHTVIAWGLALLLIALHSDVVLGFVRPQRVMFYLGWVPEELSLRVLWMFLTWLYLLYFCAYIWREDDD